MSDCFCTCAGYTFERLASRSVADVFLGVDVGGSGIKVAPVDVVTGRLVADRVRVKTPQPSTPDAVARTVSELVSDFGETERVGIGFPAVVDTAGIVHTAMNIDEKWVGVNARSLFGDALKRDVSLINDADAAALAELEFGAARGVSGTVIVLTFGTGIGSGFIVDGHLARNVELGVVELDGFNPAESHFSAKARRREDLDWDQWGARANRYLTHINRVFAPVLMVFGGGVSKHWGQFRRHFDNELPIRRATTGNSAGLIGAALVASREQTD